MNRTASASVSVLALALAVAASPAARAETTQCMEITSLPTTLSTQGIYCLKKDLATAMTSGDAVTFAANNITLDCNGYKIGGLLAGPGTAATGLAASGRLNLVVRNCNIRGFREGIDFGGGGHLIEQNRLDGITAIGIRTAGDGNRIRNNAVYDTGGSAVYGYAIAILAVLDAEITGNTIQGVEGIAGPAAGIGLENSSAGLIADNSVRGLVATGATIGISVASSTDPLVRGNHIGGPGTTGIDCSTQDAHVVGNQVIGFTAGLSGCLDGGGNYVAP